MLTLMADGDKQLHPRRRAYLIALPLTLGAVLLTYLVELSRGAVDPFNRVVLPLLAVLLGLLAAAHAPRLLDLRRVERGFFAAAALAYFGKLGFTLLGPYAPLDRAHELGQVYIWTPFIYALAFLAGTPRASRYRAGGVYLVSRAGASDRSATADAMGTSYPPPVMVAIGGAA